MLTDERPAFTCPRCSHTTRLPSDVHAGYCPRCAWWTGDSLLGSPDVLAQAEIDGPFALDGRAELRERAERIAALRASHAVNLAERIAPAIGALGRAFASLVPVMNRVVASFKLVADTLEERGLVRHTSKRLRNGTVRHRYKLVPQPQPRPWKVDR